MKKSDMRPNTVYRVRDNVYHWSEFLLTGDEIVGVFGDSTHDYDRSAKRYIEVYPVRWDAPELDMNGKYVAADETCQIAFRAIDDMDEWGSLEELTIERRVRLVEQEQRHNEAVAERAINKARWAAIDTATLDLLGIDCYDRPGAVRTFANEGSLTRGAANTGEPSVKVRLSLDDIEKIDALLASQAVSA